MATNKSKIVMRVERQAVKASTPAKPLRAAISRYVPRVHKNVVSNHYVGRWGNPPIDWAALAQWEREGREARAALEAYHRVLNNDAVVVEGVSYTDILKKTPCFSQGCVSGLPPPKEEKGRPLITRTVARQLATDAFKTFQQERSQARALAEAIAARYAVTHFVKKVRQARKPSLVKIIRAARRTAREARKPQCLPAFRFADCEYEKPAETTKVGPWFFRKNFGNSKSRGFGKVKKQVKVIRPVVVEIDDESWYTPYPRVEQPELTAAQKRTVARQQRVDRTLYVYKKLSESVLGSDLVMAFARVKAARMGLSLDVKNPVEPQMDTNDPDGKYATIIDKMSNTAIDSLQQVDVGVPHAPTRGAKDMAVSGERQTYQSMSNRWIYVQDYSWNTSAAVGQSLAPELWLPYDVIKNNHDSINTQLFYTHRWFKGDMVIKVNLNSNRFQVGQLIASVIYGRGTDDITLWDNIYSSLQRNHTRLMAGTSNDALITVPFKWQDSVMSFGVDSRMCKFNLRVLNPLVVTEGVAPSCKLSVYISFENIEFFGMISRSLGIEGQMDSAANLLNAGSNLIRTLRGDPNRDNPPLPLQPVSFVPQSMTSLASMDHALEPINVLRADPAGQTPYIDVVDEMNALSIMKGWGFRQTVSWSTSDGTGAQLWTSPVVPTLNTQFYPSGVIKGTCIPTPLSYVSSLYAFWRGEIEYRFDVVASSFHTGRIMIGAIPLYGKDKVTLEVLKCSAYRVADIASPTSVTFSVPWQWKNAFAENRFTELVTDVPSRIFVLVINPLIAVDSVSPKVYINVFERAGSNFEVSIPRPPIWDPNWSDTTIIPESTYLKPYDTAASWYTTWNRNLVKRDGKYLHTIYYKNATDCWVGYTNLQPGQLYKLSATGSKSGKTLRTNLIGKYMSYDEDSKKWVETQVQGPIMYGVYDEALTSNYAHGMIVAPSIFRPDMINFCRYIRQGWSFRDARSKLPYWWTQDGDWTEIYDESSQTWSPLTDQDDRPVWSFEIFNLESFIDQVEPQMDTKPMDIPVSLDVPSGSTYGGLTIFGEKFPDLKSLCRRYNHYCSMILNTTSERIPRDAAYSARIRVNPLRRVKPLTSASYDNRYRHGITTTIGSMYKFWKGGLRYRFTVVGAPPEGTVLYVQHRFDQYITEPTNNYELGPEHVRTRDDMMSTQYATFSQILSVNASFVVEVPYYQQYDQLSIPNSADSPRDNGCLYIWLHSKSKQTVSLEVLYSFADETRFSVFQGVPVSRDISILKPEPEPQMDEKPSKSFTEKFTEKFLKVNKMDKLEEKVEKVTESAVSASDSWSEMCSTITDVVKKMGKAFKVDELSEKGFSKVIKEQITSSCFSAFSVAAVKWFKYVNPLVYLILSPTLPTLCWTIINLYLLYFGLRVSHFQKLGEVVSELWHRVVPSQRTQEQPEAQDGIIPEIASCCGFMFTLIQSACGIKSRNLSLDCKGIADGLFTFGSAARSGHFVVSFLKDFIEMTQRVFNKVMDFFKVPDENIVRLVVGEGDTRLQNWFAECQIVLAPQNATKVKSDQVWYTKAFELGVVGRAILSSMLNSTMSTSALMPMVYSTVNDLKKLEKQLIDSKVYSGIRYEPHVIWVCGGAGTGKTRYLQSLARELSKRAGYDGHVAYHTMTAGQKYFDAFDGQQVVILDDFLALSPAADPESYVQFLQMCSSNIFNPPFAIAEDKHKLLNFQNVCVSSNKKYFTEGGAIHDTAAYNRRRHVVVEFEFAKPDLQAYQLTSTYTIQQLEDMEHLNVKIYPDVINNTSSSVPLVVPTGKTTRQALDAFLLSKADKYHNVQSLVYKKAVQDKLDSFDNVKGMSDFEAQLKEYQKVLDKFGSDSKSPWSKLFSKWVNISKEASTFVPEYTDKLPDAVRAKELKKKGVENLAREIAAREQSQVEGQMNPFRQEDPEYDREVFESLPYTLEPPEIPGQIKILKGKQHLFQPEKCFHNTFKPLLWYYDPEHNEFVDSILTPSCRLPYEDCVPGAGSSSETCICYRSQLMEILDSKRPMILDSGFYRTYEELDRQFFDKNWEANIRTYSKDYMDYLNIKLLRQIKADPKSCSQLIKPWKGVSYYQRRRLLETVTKYQEFDQTRFEKVGNWLVDKFNLGLFHCANFVEFVSMTGRLGAFCIAIVVLYAVLVAVATINLIRTLKAEPQLHPSGDYKNIKNARAVRTQAARLITNQSKEWVKQVISPINPKDGVVNKIRNNMFTLVGKIQKDGVDGFQACPVHCLGLYNRTFICLEHYIDHFTAMGVKEVVVVFHGGDSMFTCLLKDIQFTWGPQGYGVGILPASGCPRQFSKITQLIPSEKFDGNYPSKVILLESDPFACKQVELEMKKLQYSIKVPGNKTQKSWVIEQGFEYPYGYKGLCGSVLIAPEMACPLIGIHTAGIQDRRGYSEMLLRETFECVNEIPLDVFVPQMTSTDGVYELDGVYQEVGQLPPNLVPRTVSKTKIVPSEIHGVFPVVSEPAPLVGNDERLESKEDILRIGTSKRCDPMKPYPKDMEDKVLDHFMGKLMRVVKPQRAEVGVLSYAQAIDGLPLPGYDPLVLSTSEGYPWNLDRPAGESGKSWLIRSNDDVMSTGHRETIAIHQDLYDVLQFNEELRANGVIPISHFQSQLKDARISKKKIPIPGSTRIFEMSPFQLTIAQRQYNLDFTVAYREARLQAEHTIGINPDGPEWSELANNLNAFSPYISTADFKGYGPRISHQLLYMAGQLSEMWYYKYEDYLDEETRLKNLITRNVLTHEVVNGLHVCRDLVFRPSSGQPSGNSETVEMNSKTNSLNIRMAFLGLAKEHAPQYSNLDYFDMFVLLYTNGDDLIMAIKEDIIGWFNNNNLIDFFGRYGLVMTDAEKSGVVRPYCTLLEAQYLKRGFVPHPTRDGQWMAPLSEDSVTDTANWCWRSVNNRGDSLQNSEMSCRLAYTLGPDKYYKIASAIRDAWMERGVVFDYPSWESLDNHVWDNVIGPKFYY